VWQPAIYGGPVLTLEIEAVKAAMGQLQK